MPRPVAGTQRASTVAVLLGGKESFMMSRRDFKDPRWRLFKLGAVLAGAWSPWVSMSVTVDGGMTKNSFCAARILGGGHRRRHSGGTGIVLRSPLLGGRSRGTDVRSSERRVRSTSVVRVDLGRCTVLPKLGFRVHRNDSTKSH